MSTTSTLSPAQLHHVPQLHAVGIKKLYECVCVGGGEVMNKIEVEKCKKRNLF